MSGLNESKKSDGGLASVLNVIPSVYYDLIARIAPGVAFWAALTIDTTKPINLKNVAPTIPENIFIVIILGYLTGMVLTGFAIVWDYASLAIFRQFPDTAQEGLGLVKGKTLLEQWKIVAEKMDELDQKSSEGGRTVAKALAEVALCQNLLSGLLMLTCVGIISHGQLFTTPCENITSISLLAITFFLAATFRQAMFLGRVQTLHRIHAPLQSANLNY